MGVSLSPGSLNLHRKFERPSGRPRRGESQSDESSRDAASASHHIDLMRKCEGFFICRNLVGVSLSPGSLNLSSKFEGPSGRPRRGEELSSESSRDAASALHHIDLMRMCEGFFIWRSLVGVSLKLPVHKEHSDAERPHGQPPSLKKKGDKQRFESSRGGTLPQPDIIVTKPRIPNYTQLVNKLLNQVILACITFKRPY